MVEVTLSLARPLSPHLLQHSDSTVGEWDEKSMLRSAQAVNYLHLTSVYLACLPSQQAGQRFAQDFSLSAPVLRHISASSMLTLRTCSPGYPLASGMWCTLEDRHRSGSSSLCSDYTPTVFYGAWRVATPRTLHARANPSQHSRCRLTYRTN